MSSVAHWFMKIYLSSYCVSSAVFTFWEVSRQLDTFFKKSCEILLLVPIQAEVCNSSRARWNLFLFRGRLLRDHPGLSWFYPADLFFQNICPIKAAKTECSAAEQSELDISNKWRNEQLRENNNKEQGHWDHLPTMFEMADFVPITLKTSFVKNILEKKSWTNSN